MQLSAAFFSPAAADEEKERVAQEKYGKSYEELDGRQRQSVAVSWHLPTDASSRTLSLLDACQRPLLWQHNIRKGTDHSVISCRALWVVCTDVRR